tara:strand:+ start:434 stop:757 length:324 start_codon:yes stop_codon:yes gene_type:complete
MKNKSTHLSTISKKQREKMAAASSKAKKLSHNILKLIDSELPYMVTEQRQKVEQKLLLMPVSFRRTYITAMKAKSRATAMKAFCNECLGYEQTEACVCSACPLYPYR